MLELTMFCQFSWLFVMLKTSWKQKSPLFHQVDWKQPKQSLKQCLAGSKCSLIICCFSNSKLYSDWGIWMSWFSALGKVSLLYSSLVRKIWRKTRVIRKEYFEGFCLFTFERAKMICASTSYNLWKRKCFFWTEKNVTSF